MIVGVFTGRAGVAHKQPGRSESAGKALSQMLCWIGQGVPSSGRVPVAQEQPWFTTFTHVSVCVHGLVFQWHNHISFGYYLSPRRAGVAQEQPAQLSPAVRVPSERGRRLLRSWRVRPGQSRAGPGAPRKPNVPNKWP